MAVNLKLYDEDDNEITLLNGIDFGLTRMRYPVVKKMYLRNLGNDNAKNLTITADTLNKKEDISNEEYEKQVKAKRWKSFSLDNKNFSEILDLGKVLKGSYYEGIKEVKFDLTSSKGTLKEEWTNAVPNFIDSKLVFRKTTYESEDKAQGTGSARFLVDIGTVRDIDLTFYMNYIGDSNTSYSAIATFLIPIRIGSDGFGYGLLIQRNRANNKMFFAVYKRTKGMLDANTSIMGTRIININSYIDLDETKPMRIKVYNNENGEPTFEFYCNDKQQLLYSSSDKTKSAYAFTDNAEGYYPAKGSMYFDLALYKGDIEFDIYNVNLITEEQKQPIYMKTFIEKDAIDKEIYKSSLKLEWTE